MGLSENEADEHAVSARYPVGAQTEHPSPEVAAPAGGGYFGATPTTHLVARGRELAHVLESLDAAEGGSGRLVLVAGEPGVGKTRLAQEVSVNARERGFVVAAGRCYEAQNGVSFYPFLDALSALYEAAPPGIRGAIPERYPYLVRLLPDQYPPRSADIGRGREDSQRLPSCSTTCTARTVRAWSFWRTSPGTPRRSGCCSWASTVT